MRIRASLMGVLLLLLSGCRGGSVVAPAEAHRLVEEEGGLLLDVRTPGEYGQRHLDGALNIPVGELAGRLHELPRDRPIIVYCQSGVRSTRAAELLRRKGYDRVYDLGGLGNW